MRRLAPALAFALAAWAWAAPAWAEPAFTFEAPGWEMGVGPAEVYAFQSLAPRPGAVALSVTLHSGPARTLERLTESSLGETLILRDGDGAILVEMILVEPIRRGAFAVTFADPDAARLAAARMLGR